MSEPVESPPVSPIRHAIDVLALVVTLLAIAFPVMALSALYTRTFRHLNDRHRKLAFLVIAACALSTLLWVLDWKDMAPFALLRTVLGGIGIGNVQLPAVGWDTIAVQSFFEFYAGPIFYLLVRAGYEYSVAGSLAHSHQRRKIQQQRLEDAMIKGEPLLPKQPLVAKAGSIPLGWRIVDGKGQSVTLATLARALAIVGSPGMGKTVFLRCLIRSLLQQARELLPFITVVDGKADASFRIQVMHLAEEYGVPFYELSDEPTSMTLDALGAFTPEVAASVILNSMDFGAGNAIIYKELAGNILVLVIAALQEVGEPVTLETVRASLSMPGLLDLARRSSSPDLKDLSTVAATKHRTLESEAIKGLHHRLSRLLRSKFGSILVSSPGRPNLSLMDVVERPGIAYVGVSAHGSSDDSRLVIAILLQLLAELARRRNTLIAEGKNVLDLFLIIDEFAQISRSRSEAESVAIESRLSNFFEMARSSKIIPVPAMQVLPVSESLLVDLFGAGLLVIFRTPQAEQIGKMLGGIRGGSLTKKLGSGGEDSLEGTYTPDETEWAANPDALRRLGRGVAIIRMDNGLPIGVLMDHDLAMDAPTNRSIWRRLWNWLTKVI